MLVFIVRKGLWVTGSDLSTSHCETLDIQIKYIATSVQLDFIVFLSNQEASCVQCHFKLWRHTDKACSDTFFNSVPVKLKCQNVIVRICLRIVIRPGLDIPLIVQVSLFFFHVDRNPVVEATNFVVLNFPDEDMLKSRRIRSASTSTRIQLKPNTMQDINKAI